MHCAPESLAPVDGGDVHHTFLTFVREFSPLGCVWAGSRKAIAWFEVGARAGRLPASMACWYERCCRRVGRVSTSGPLRKLLRKLRSNSLSLCVRLCTLVSLYVQHRKAMRAGCGVLTHGQHFAAESIPPASTEKLLFYKDLRQRNRHYGYFSGNFGTIHRPNSPDEPRFQDMNAVTRRGGSAFSPRLQSTPTITSDEKCASSYPSLGASEGAWQSPVPWPSLRLQP